MKIATEKEYHYSLHERQLAERAHLPCKEVRDKTEREACVSRQMSFARVMLGVGGVGVTLAVRGWRSGVGVGGWYVLVFGSMYFGFVQLPVVPMHPCFTHDVFRTCSFSMLTRPIRCSTQFCRIIATVVWFCCIMPRDLLNPRVVAWVLDLPCFTTLMEYRVTVPWKCHLRKANSSLNLFMYDFLVVM